MGCVKEVWQEARENLGLEEVADLSAEEREAVKEEAAYLLAREADRLVAERDTAG